jgi:hypothetical protein
LAVVVVGVVVVVVVVVADNAVLSVCVDCSRPVDASCAT